MLAAAALAASLALALASERTPESTSESSESCAGLSQPGTRFSTGSCCVRFRDVSCWPPIRAEPHLQTPEDAPAHSGTLSPDARTHTCDTFCFAGAFSPAKRPSFVLMLSSASLSESFKSRFFPGSQVEMTPSLRTFTYLYSTCSLRFGTSTSIFHRGQSGAMIITFSHLPSSGGAPTMAMHSSADVEWHSTWNDTLTRFVSCWASAVESELPPRRPTGTFMADSAAEAARQHARSTTRSGCARIFSSLAPVLPSLYVRNGGKRRPRCQKWISL